MDTKHLAILGAGNMGRALIGGLLRKGTPAERISVGEAVPAARETLARELGLQATADNLTAVEHAQVVVLAIKPQDIAAALQPLQPVLQRNRPLVLSVAAGVRVAALQAACGPGVPVVRAMPNTPAAIGRGMTVMTPSAAVTAAQRMLADELLGAVGATAWVDDEALMDPVTAVSGSGPAYVFLLIECLTRAGVKAGLDPELAERLATVTVAGAGAYAERSGEPAAELRRRVTSPNGTTEAALRVLMGEGGLEGLLERAVRAAADRSRELSAA